jgi:hypothetical protein
MRPATVHTVLTVEDSVFQGMHLYCYSTMPYTAKALLAQHFGAQLTSNAEHPEIEIVRFLMTRHIRDALILGRESPAFDASSVAIGSLLAITLFADFLGTHPEEPADGAPSVPWRGLQPSTYKNGQVNGPLFDADLFQERWKPTWEAINNIFCFTSLPWDAEAMAHAIGQFAELYTSFLPADGREVCLVNLTRRMSSYIPSKILSSTQYATGQAARYQTRKRAKLV